VASIHKLGHIVDKPRREVPLPKSEVSDVGYAMVAVNAGSDRHIRDGLVDGRA
jgi:hypothetical protein